MCLSDQGKHKFEGDKLIFIIFLPLKASFNSNFLSTGGNFDKDPCSMNGNQVAWNGKRMERNGMEWSGGQDSKGEAVCNIVGGGCF